MLTILEDDSVHGFGKLVPYGSIFILFSIFSRTFWAVCVPMNRMMTLFVYGIDF